MSPFLESRERNKFLQRELTALKEEHLRIQHSFHQHAYNQTEKINELEKRNALLRDKLFTLILSWGKI